MSDRRLRLASAALAAAGAAVSAYLLYVREAGGSLVCSTGGCETVQSSDYAEALGLPVAALGLVGFLGLLGATLAPGELARLTHATLGLAAFLFAAYLLAIQLFVLDALCQWCLATDLLTTRSLGSHSCVSGLCEHRDDGLERSGARPRRRLLARGELSLRRSDLPARQPAPARAPAS